MCTGLYKGGSINLSFRNEWYLDQILEINRLEVLVGDRVIMDEKIVVEPACYFATTIHVPFDLAPGQQYDVTLNAFSAEGYNSTYTRTVTCEYYRIGGP